MFPRETPSDRQLRPPWAGLLGACWTAIGVALVAAGASSRAVGKPAWWLGDAVPVGPTVLWLAPLVGPFLAVVLSRRSAPLAISASAVATVLVLAVALGDLGASPATGVVEMVLTGAGALVTVAASAGLPPRRRRSTR